MGPVKSALSWRQQDGFGKLKQENSIWKHISMYSIFLINVRGSRADKERKWKRENSQESKSGFMDFTKMRYGPVFNKCCCVELDGSSVGYDSAKVDLWNIFSLVIFQISNDIVIFPSVLTLLSYHSPSRLGHFLSNNLSGYFPSKIQVNNVFWRVKYYTRNNIYRVNVKARCNCLP